MSVNQHLRLRSSKQSAREDLDLLHLILKQVRPCVVFEVFEGLCPIFLLHVQHVHVEGILHTGLQILHLNQYLLFLDDLANPG